MTRLKVTGPLNFWKFHSSKSISFATYRGSWQMSTISKFGPYGFLKFVLVFVSRDLELGRVPAVSPSNKKFFRFQWNLVCTYRSMSDARQYAVWPDSRSRSRSRRLKFQNCTFPPLSPLPFTMAAGKWPLILNLQHNVEIWSRQIFDIYPSFLCHVTLNLVQSLQLVG